MATVVVLEDGQRLTVKEGSVFPIVQKLSDLTTPDSRSGSYSKTIVFDGSKENILILGCLFDVNLINSSFDINAKVKADVYQEDVNVFPNCYLQLKKVIKKAKASVTTIDEVEFKGVVYNDVSDFFRQINNKELTDLKIGGPDTNHELNVDNIIASTAHDYTDKYTYPLNFNSSDVYLVSFFKPAIFTRVFWDAIFASSGFDYVWDSIDDDDIQLNKLLIPFSGKFEPTGEIINNEIVDIGTNMSPDPDESPVNEGMTDYVFQPFYRSNGPLYLTQESGANIPSTEPTQTSYAPYIKIISNENKDIQGQYNTSTGRFTANLTDVYDIDIEAVFQVDLNASANVELFGNNGTLQYNFFPFVDWSGSTSYQPSGQSIQLSFDQGDTLISGSNLFTGTFIGRITQPMNSGNTIDLLGWGMKAVAIGNYSTGWGGTSLLDPHDVTPTLSITSINVRITPRITYQEGLIIDLNAFIPKKIKQSDFVKSILTKFNLMMIPDEDQDNLFRIIKRDDFYDSGVQWDFSDKLARDKDFEVEFLPNVVSKSIELSDKDDKDPHNVSYLNSVRKTYGQLRYNFQSENVKGVNRIETIFSPTPIGLTTFGAYAPFIPLTDPELNIRMLYHVGEKTANYTIQDSSGIQLQTTYNCAHHMDDPIYPSYDLNFGVCDFYFYPGIRITYNNAFNNHYRRTFKQINDGKRGTGWFNLSHAVKAKIKLNDRIYINNSWWNIEDILYNANDPGLTKMVLISIDDELSIKPIPRLVNGSGTVNTGFGNGSSPDDVSTGVSVISTPTLDFVTSDEVNMNILGGNNTGSIRGRGNLIQAGINSFVVGNNNKVVQDGAVVFGDDMFVDQKGLWAEGIYFKDGSYLTSGKSVSEQEWEGVLSQTSTNAPVIDEVYKEDFEVTTSRSNIGEFQLLSDGLFIEGKTHVEFTVNKLREYYFWSWIDESTILITTTDSNVTNTDGLLTYQKIKIKVY